MAHKTETGGLASLATSAGRETDNTGLLTCDCDVLIPAALENQITAENADSVQASVILELANGPTAPEADKRLAAAGKVVVPDILANAGGVTVSYFEWVQNKSGFYWNLAEVQRRLAEVLEPEAERIWALRKDKGIDMRTAAYVHALGRLADAIDARGTKDYFNPGR
jgi:glutamate dehydrogenase (NADP+)